MCPRYLPSLFCRFLTSRTQEKYVQGLLGFTPRTCLYLSPAGGRLRTQPAVPSRAPCEGRAERAPAALHQVSLAPHPALTSQLDTTKATALPLVMKPVPAFCVPTPFYFFCLVPWRLPAQRYSPSSRLHLLLCPQVLLKTGILTRKAVPGARPPLSDAACPLCPLPARDCPSVSPSMSSCPWPLRSAWSKNCKMAAIGSFK